MKRTGLLFFFCLAVAVRAVPVPDLQKFENCTFVASDWADGDSFPVEISPGRQEVIRLYFVDCPETSAGTESDQRRVREQSAYFGVEDHKLTLESGRQAAAEVAKVLSKPFTVHTVFTRALGRSAKPRIYAFVTTSDGKDLGELLVGKGLARSHGVGRTTPDGVAVDDAKAKIEDLELQAAVQKAGLWAKTDASKLAALREARREESRKLEEEFEMPPDNPVDANTATLAEIEGLPGIGRVLAERIVGGRPYKSIDDLRNVSGMSEKKWEQLKDSLRVGPAAPTPPAAARAASSPAGN